MQRYDKAKVEDLPKAVIDTIANNTTKKTVTDRYTGEEKKYNVLSKGLFLFGNTGTGKTHALYAINNLVNIGKVENWVELLFELKGKFEVRDGVRTLIDDITEKQYIFLDDLGAEKQTEWSQEMLYLIINRAYNTGKTLFISTNLNETEFVSKYGERIFDRIQEICDLVNMPKINHRQK